MQNNLLLANPAGDEKLYVEDVFSTHLYSGTSAPQTISNGIDLSTKGGLVWIKSRAGTATAGYDKHLLFDTVRGNTVSVSTNNTAPNEVGWSNLFIRFQATGFDTGTGTSGDQQYLNKSGVTYASWTFREAPKFLDIVTYTGDGATLYNRWVNHSLGTVPGMVIVKCTSTTSNWGTWCRLNDTTVTYNMYFNTTAASAASLTLSAHMTATSFRPPEGFNVNGATYVAYLFAHDTTADGIVQCGSYTGNGSATGPIISLGWQPQYVLIKSSSNALNWHIVDVMRGMTVDQGSTLLYPNLTNADGVAPGISITPTPTGFQVNTVSTSVNTSGATYIYMAIRSGPMRVPTDATKVFEVVSRLGNATDPTVVGSSVLTDMALIKNVTSTTTSTIAVDRLRGTPYLLTTGQAAENTTITNVVNTTAWATMTGVRLAGGAANTNNLTNGTSINSYVNYLFRRAPVFFDVVCYTGTGSARTVSHNLGVNPELMIVKSRSDGTRNWSVYEAGLGTAFYLNLNDTSSKNSTSTTYWNSTSPTSTVFSLGAGLAVNASGATYVAYLFASCPGVSKVGSYTGTGTTLQINCGFTNGARFVLIKRTDSTGDWYVWDSARGIIAGNDPYLLLNSTAAEVTNTDYVDAYSAGFELSSTAPAALNANGGTYIFLAIA